MAVLDATAGLQHVVNTNRIPQYGSEPNVCIAMTLQISLSFHRTVAASSYRRIQRGRAEPVTHMRGDHPGCPASIITRHDGIPSQAMHCRAKNIPCAHIDRYW